LVRAQELQLRIFDEAVTLAGIVPTGIVPVVRVLSYRNVIRLDLFADQSVGVGLEGVKVPKESGVGNSVIRAGFPCSRSQK